MALLRTMYSSIGNFPSETKISAEYIQYMCVSSVFFLFLHPSYIPHFLLTASILFLLLFHFVCTRYFICLIRRGKVHENCFPFCCCCCFFLFFSSFICSRFRCRSTFYFTFFLRILCTTTISVCFSFSHRILSSIVITKKRSRLPLVILVLHFALRLLCIQAIRLYLLAVLLFHDM